MLKNYFKIAIAVLKRRKFFTFISLFGISFTLTILIVLTSFLDHLLSPSYPDINRDRELYINKMIFRSTKNDYFNGGSPTLYFYQHYVSTLKTPYKLAIYTEAENTNAYQNNKKIVFEQKYTNIAYWEVYQFQFIEGKPYNQQELKNADHVVVISEDARDNYFGKNVLATGKYLEANDIKYRVTGVVKTAPYLDFYCYADLYLPYTLSKQDLKTRNLMGGFSATMLADSKTDLPKIKAEYLEMVKKLPIDKTEDNMNVINSYADYYLEGYSRSLSSEPDNGLSTLYFYFGLFIFFFMLLPTINLVNINISRIMERSSEIGVRKAFGASSKTLTYQFIVENLILTFLGGVLGIVLSSIVIYLINSAEIVPNLKMHINLTVLFYGLLACLIFGLLSGVYPAWRMSKLNVVTALKANN
ncbi:ABC transporter permease [Pedobacter sp. L105]|uniref:ABC transporter permease n=1 Tax=Pedobacter sp. L105 TaxID=1641871 RepID=UPI00131B38F6|nr:ABC transporter permease [Pedobacter sp. L105]